ncbi:MAG TPA: hypothetical protein VIJ47_04250 [Acidimicrobiales bacterium]
MTNASPQGDLASAEEWHGLQLQPPTRPVKRSRSAMAANFFGWTIGQLMVGIGVAALIGVLIGVVMVH